MKVAAEPWRFVSSTWFAQLADGSVVLLVGPHLEEAEEAGEFPATRFRGRLGRVERLRPLGEEASARGSHRRRSVRRSPTPSGRSSARTTTRRSRSSGPRSSSAPPASRCARRRGTGRGPGGMPRRVPPRGLPKPRRHLRSTRSARSRPSGCPAGRSRGPAERNPLSQYSGSETGLAVEGGGASPARRARTARATRSPSREAETIPPAKPAPSPAGKRPGSDGDSHASFRSIRIGDEVRDSGAIRTASSETKPRIFVVEEAERLGEGVEVGRGVDRVEAARDAGGRVGPARERARGAAREEVGDADRREPRTSRRRRRRRPAPRAAGTRRRGGPRGPPPPRSRQGASGRRGRSSRSPIARL